MKLAVGEKRGWESKTNKCVLCYRKSESFPLWESCSLAAGVPAACCPSCRATLPASSRGHAPASSAPLGGAFCPRAHQAELSDSSSPTICGCSCCSFSLHLFPAFFSTVSAQSSVSVILVVIPASRLLVQLPFSHPISLFSSYYISVFFLFTSFHLPVGYSSFLVLDPDLGVVSPSLKFTSFLNLSHVPLRYYLSL